MKKYLIILFALILFGSAQNLLQNPGFEFWSGGMPDYWEKGDSILIFQEDVIVHGGNFSVKDSLFTQEQSTADFFQGRFAVQPNTQYNFTIWVYDNDPAGRLRHGVYWYPSGSNWSPTYSVDSAGWQELTFTAISPSGTDSALIIIRAYDVSTNWDGGAIFYIDDALFEASSTQPPVINRVWHTPINPGPGVTVDVYAKVSDNGSIIADTLYYGINNLNSPTKVSHSAVSNDTFKYQVSGQTTDDTIFYYLKFTDNDGLETFSDTHSYYVGVLNIFINEVYYDTPGTDSGCFVEVFGQTGTNLDGYTLVGVNGNGGTVYVTIDLSGYAIPGDGFFVVAEYATVPNADFVTLDADLQNGPDNLELRFNNITIDAMGYGTLNGWVFTGEWLPSIDVEYGYSLGRYPDGYDTDNNSVDFYDYSIPTPGEPNPPGGVNENNFVGVSLLPVISNPVNSGIMFASLIDNDDFYPIIVYNTLGQVVEDVSKAEDRLNLPCGIYFLKLYTIDRGCVKIVVVR